MNKVAFGVAAALTAGIFGMAAIAQEEGESHFKKADTNSDGAISWEEAVAYYPKATEADFAAVDLNGDGVLSAEELDALSNLIEPNPLSPGAQIDQEKRDDNSSSSSSMDSSMSSELSSAPSTP